METIRLKQGKIMPHGATLKVVEIGVDNTNDFIAAAVEEWVQEQSIHIYDIKYSTSGKTSSALIIFSQVTE